MVNRITFGLGDGVRFAQRSLQSTTSELTKNFERLSSGLRINRASDDAAGLAISEKLNVETRVYTQAIRNANDGISLLNVAEGAVEQLSEILTRLKELAIQASNGSFTRAQRLLLDQEALALKNEFNRITESTKFSTLNLTDGSLDRLNIQLGYGIDGSLSLRVGEDLERRVGDGTYQALTSYSAGTPINTIALDVNGDNVLDLISTDQGNDRINVLIGNGNGTFQARVTYTAGDGPFGFSYGDLNNDGILDIVTASLTDNKVNVLLGNGNGTFQARTSYAGGTSTQDVVIGDINRDGILDLISSDNTTASVFLGNGNGTFQARVSYSAGSGNSGVTVDDLNGDGVLDIITASFSTDQIGVLIGNSDGTFKASAGYLAGDGVLLPVSADLNFDGIPDIVTASQLSGNLQVFLGNGDGTFGAAVTYASGSNTLDVALADVNGDGFLDMLSASSGDQKIGVYLGNGNGTFRSRVTYAGLTGNRAVTAGDVNGDGALDLISASSSNLNVHLANGQQLTTIQRLNLTSASSAREALATIDAARTRVLSELGTLGAAQSRLSTTRAHLNGMRDNFRDARSKIIDVDIAEEIARFTRNQILRDATAAILAQANQAPQVALSLLTGGT